MPTLSGEVQRVTFENEETGFRVLKLTAARAPGNAPPPERSFGAGNFGLSSSAGVSTNQFF